MLASWDLRRLLPQLGGSKYSRTGRMQGGNVCVHPCTQGRGELDWLGDVPSQFVAELLVDGRMKDSAVVVNETPPQEPKTKTQMRVNAYINGCGHNHIFFAKLLKGVYILTCGVTSCS